MSTKIRTAFFTRVESTLYSYLRSHPLFKDWQDTVELYQIVFGIVRAKREEINALWDSQNFSVKEVDKAVDLVMNKILIPEIEKLRI